MVRPYQSMKDELMANTAAIEVHNLTKTYPSAGKGRERKLVLDGISFTVPENTVVSFLGHNGAGYRRFLILTPEKYQSFLTTL